MKHLNFITGPVKEEYIKDMFERAYEEGRENIKSKVELLKGEIQEMIDADPLSVNNVLPEKYVEIQKKIERIFKEVKE